MSSVVGAWLRLRLALWLLRTFARLVGWLVTAAVIVAAWPLSIVAAIGYLTGWLRGWPPARLWHAAAWSLVMTGVYAIAWALHVHGWQAVLLSPVTDWRHAWRLIAAGHVVSAFALTVPVAVPVGLALAGVLWAWRIYAVTTGLAGRAATAPVTFDTRQWRRQARAARGRIAAPGAVPLVTSAGMVPVGGTIRTVGHRWRPVLTVDYRLFTRHQVIIGSSGSGKTNLMMRLWAGSYAAAHAASARDGTPRPLLIVLDCKGGADAREKAARTRRLLHGVGARRVAIWPDEARLSLWDLPARDLAVVLLQMLETGEGAAAYYTDITQAVLNLAVAAPCGPPRSAAEFLSRLDAGWLEAAYGDGSHDGELARITAARPHLGDIQLRYGTLLSRLGPALNGPGRLDDADAWYLILEGTREPSVAEAQAMAVVELVAHAATSSGRPRTILLAADDYSAVSRRVPISNLYERGRSLGLGVQVSAQSWQGLGRDEDERRRIAATADGGLWLLKTPDPDDVVRLAGTRRVLETAHKLIGNVWGDEGTSRVQHAWTVDPDLIRALDVGQACYIHSGAATHVHIARPRPSPLSLPTVRHPDAPTPTSHPPLRSRWQNQPTPQQPRPEPADLDDVLGPGAPT